MTLSKTTSGPSAPTTPRVVEIAHHGFRLGILPELGGSLSHLTWTPPGREPNTADIDLMRRARPDDVTSGNPSRLASFAMVPFTNRIDGGRIPFRGSSGRVDEVHVPINRPAQNAAIHGFGRFAPWSVIEIVASRIRLKQTFSESGNPYSYEAEQTFSLAPDYVDCVLVVTNQGRSELPFGIGFHPWFDRTPMATLEFSASTAYRMDGRDMPDEEISAHQITGTQAPSQVHRFVVSTRTPFDTPISGWDGKATITWPERRTRLDIAATDAFQLVHIFSPREPAVFCVEPVSHLPDVVNRRHLAIKGDMRLLAPGQSMAGTMRLVPSTIG